MPTALIYITIILWAILCYQRMSFLRNEAGTGIGFLKRRETRILFIKEVFISMVALTIVLLLIVGINMSD